MLCEYVIAMRVFFTQTTLSEPHDFTEWHSVLSFINGNKFSQEVQGIKLKLQAIESGLTKESIKERCPSILLRLKQLYFPDENSSQMLLN